MNSSWVKINIKNSAKLELTLNMVEIKNEPRLLFSNNSAIWSSIYENQRNALTLKTRFTVNELDDLVI